MDQDDTLDFKALRAKFQVEESLLTQPKPPTIKPAVPEKPKLVLPPQSSTPYLPAGARPSLLSSLNQSLEAKTAGAPRVVFKEDKKESKLPVIQINSKGKDKSEVKPKKSKDKSSKGKLEDDSVDQKPKSGKEKKLPLLPVAPKEPTAELVKAPPPPKVPKKKGFLGFRRSSKTYSVEVPENPILDTPSVDVPGPAPLIPVPSEFDDVPPVPQFTAPKALLPNIPTIPDSAVEITPPATIPDSPDFCPPPAFIPDVPTPKVTTPENETLPEVETPSLPIYRPASPNDSIPDPPSAAPTPPPSRAISHFPTVASILTPSRPEPEVPAPSDVEDVVVTPPSPATDPASSPPSPKAEHPISALSVLSRAEDMSPGKKADQRIFNALAKARRKSSQSTSPIKTFSSIPPLDLPPSPAHSDLDLPPIDYEGKPPKPVNGFDHRQASPVLEDEGSKLVPEPLVIPPLPRKKALPDIPSVGPTPVKPNRPYSTNLTGFIPRTAVEDNEIPALPGFIATEADELVSGHHSPEVKGSDWGNGDYAGPDSPDGQSVKEFYGNGMTPPGVHVAPDFGDPYQDNLLPNTSLPTSQDTPSLPGLGTDVTNGVYESTDNVYEDVSASAGKKKGKGDGGKKRKGPPKNPYAETQPEVINEEKSKTGRFGKNDKKAVAEGPDEKELKKREKQRLEKEKKELKERQEREKKEQKEREKRENELKKKFKITGQEDAMYQAKVTVTNKGRKTDLPITSGEIVSIIQTTNCPKGKWLARDSSNNYGYIAVDHVELNIEEMLKLKNATISRISIPPEEEVPSRPPNHYPASEKSFTDDSEEWTADDEPFSPPADTLMTQYTVGPSRAFSMPDIGDKDISINHQHSRSDNLDGGTHVQARHEALHKLATFFHSPKPVEPAASSTDPESSPVLEEEEATFFPEAGSTVEMDLDPAEMIILPPPDLYA